ncbi:MAG: pyridoxal phosphate-dependent aminotransferase [Thermodesulfobacteriota bacterium]
MDIAARIKNIQGSERSQRKITVPEGAIRLDVGDPDFPTPPHIQEAALKAMRDNFTHYGNAYGEEDLREAICYRLLQDFGVKKNPENILVTVGGIEAINAICATYLNPGDEVIVFDPGYSAYEASAALFDGQPVTVPLLDDFHIDFDLLKKKISARTKIMFLANPSNPTATVLRQEEIINLAQIAHAHNLLLVVDEVYHKLIYDGYRHFSISQIEEAKNKIILLNSFSKTYAMTGWRVGYVVAEPETIKNLVHFHRALVSCVSVPAQKACVAALLGPQDCVAQMVSEFDQRRKIVAKGLEKIARLTNHPCQGAFYFFPKFAHQLSSKEMTHYLLNKGILVRSGTEFGTQGEKHIRISFATSIADLQKGLIRLKQALDELP